MRLNEDLTFKYLNVESGVKETLMDREELALGVNSHIADEVFLLLKSQKQLLLRDELMNAMKAGKIVLVYKKSGVDVGIVPFIPVKDNKTGESFVIVNIYSFVGKVNEEFKTDRKIFTYDINFKKLYGVLVAAFGVYMAYDSNDFVSSQPCQDAIIAVTAKLWISALNRQTGISNVEGNVEYFTAILSKWLMAKTYNAEEDTANATALRVSRIKDWNRLAAFNTKYDYSYIASLDLDGFVALLRGEFVSLLKLKTSTLIDIFAIQYTPICTLMVTYPSYVVSLICSRLSGYAIYDSDVFKRDFDKLIMKYEPAFVYEMEKRLRFIKKMS